MAVLVAILGFVACQAALAVIFVRGQRRLDRSNEAIVDYLEKVDTLLAGINRALTQTAPGQNQALKMGSTAPGFTLPDLAGRERRLDEFLGKPFVLTFFSTTCGFCQQMAPKIGQLPADAPRLVLVSRGDVDDHLKLAAENKWHCDVLLESGNAVMSAYKVNGTPTAYFIDAEGRIASDLLVGADPILSLMAWAAKERPADLTLEALQEKEAAAIQKARDAGLSIRPSSIKRDGLPAGVKAPSFMLKGLDGNEYRLEDFHRKRVLLVFSDPTCGPCEALTDDLVQLQRAHSQNNLQVVMISRGEKDQNEEKARRHQINFPVLLQNRWEVSKEYAMFATPVGYLIDEQGVIAKDVAVGKAAILELV
jgi:peroxiredoxin